MYEAHFGLQGRPFDTGIAHDVDVFRGSRQNAIIDKAKLALAASDSVVTFCGPPGVGKTTLALTAVRSISTRLALAWLSSMPTNANEMLELLLIEVGINAHRASRIERLQMWRQYLEEMSATDSRVFVIAERTEEFTPEVLRALDALTGADASGSPGANVVLLGHQGLDGFLGAPTLESLRQRIRLRQRLEPFSSAELTDYLRHRVTQVGGNFEKLFAPGAAAAVYRLSAGVARLANTLCEAALTAAAAANKPALTPELITQVAVDMLGQAEHGSVPAAQAPAAQTQAAQAPTVPAAPVAASSVTIASVAIDMTPPKTASVVAAPKTASAAPQAAEARTAPAAPTAPVPPAPAPMTPAPPPVIAGAPIAAAAKPVDVAPARRTASRTDHAAAGSAADGTGARPSRGGYRRARTDRRRTGTAIHRRTSGSDGHAAPGRDSKGTHRAATDPRGHQGPRAADAHARFRRHGNGLPRCIEPGFPGADRRGRRDRAARTTRARCGDAAAVCIAGTGRQNDCRAVARGSRPERESACTPPGTAAGATGRFRPSDVTATSPSARAESRCAECPARAECRRGCRSAASDADDARDLAGQVDRRRQRVDGRDVVRRSGARLPERRARVCRRRGRRVTGSGVRTERSDTAEGFIASR